MKDEDHVPLREFIEARLSALEAMFKAEFESMQRAHDIAATRLNERLAQMNEFREQIRNERSDYLRRETFEQHVSWAESREQEIASRISALERSSANLAGRFSLLGVVFTSLIAAATLALLIWERVGK